MKNSQKNKVFGNALRGAIRENSIAKNEDNMVCPLVCPVDTTKKVAPKKDAISKAPKVQKTPKAPRVARATKAKRSPASASKEEKPSSKRTQFGVRNGKSKTQEYKSDMAQKDVDLFCSALMGIQDEHELGFFFADLLLVDRKYEKLHLVDVLSMHDGWTLVARKNIVFSLNRKVYALVMPRDMSFAEHRIRYALRDALQKIYTSKK